MSPRRRYNDWVDHDEYPDDRDIDDLGDDSPGDYDPLTIGRTHTIRALSGRGHVLLLRCCY